MLNGGLKNRRNSLTVLTVYRLCTLENRFKIIRIAVHIQLLVKEVLKGRVVLWVIHTHTAASVTSWALLCRAVNSDEGSRVHKSVTIIQIDQVAEISEEEECVADFSEVLKDFWLQGFVLEKNF